MRTPKELADALDKELRLFEDAVSGATSQKRYGKNHPQGGHYQPGGGRGEAVDTSLDSTRASFAKVGDTIGGVVKGSKPVEDVTVNVGHIVQDAANAMEALSGKVKKAGGRTEELDRTASDLKQRGLRLMFDKEAFMTKADRGWDEWGKANTGKAPKVSKDKQEARKRAEQQFKVIAPMVDADEVNRLVSRAFLSPEEANKQFPAPKAPEKGLMGRLRGK